MVKMAFASVRDAGVADSNPAVPTKIDTQAEKYNFAPPPSGGYDSYPPLFFHVFGGLGT